MVGSIYSIKACLLNKAITQLSCPGWCPALAVALPWIAVAPVLAVALPWLLPCPGFCPALAVALPWMAVAPVLANPGLCLVGQAGAGGEATSAEAGRAGEIRRPPHNTLCCCCPG